VHALDAAVLFRLVLEMAPAGTAWHAVADEGVTRYETSRRSSAAGWGWRCGPSRRSVRAPRPDLRRRSAVVECAHQRDTGLAAAAPEPSRGFGPAAL